ncbi:MAG: hypothetical protein ACXWWN_01915 [Gemmatimonadales bacterium]
MNKLQKGLLLAGCSMVLACSSEVSGPFELSATNPGTGGGSDSLVVGSLRVRCEGESNRSKISVDGNNLTPRNGRFSARVQAAGGTVASATKAAVGDEAEFDFDSSPNDIAAGAAPIPASFVAARSGPDVIGEILDSEGRVIASQGAECTFR